MNRQLKQVLAGVTLTLAMVAFAGAETLEEVEKKIIAASKELKSYTADIEYEMEMKQPNYSTTGRGEGTQQFLRSGDKVMWRVELDVRSKTSARGQETDANSSTLSVCDGKHIYTLMDQAGNKMATKMNMDPTKQGVVDASMFEGLRKEHELKLLADKKVGEMDVYVIEATPKAGKAQTGPTIYHISKDHGMVVKYVTMSPDGQPMMNFTYKNVKTNVKVDPKRFEFEAPAGVRVMDMTER